MKKILVFISVMMMVLLSGCKKEEDKGLAGTVWEQNDGTVVVTITFTSIQAVVDFGDGGNYFSYEYQKPTVLMYPEDTKYATMKGIISGDQMSVVNTSNGKTIGIFTKR